MRLRIRLKTRASMKVLRLAALGLAAFGLTAGSAGAQFLQYTPPGGPEETPGVAAGRSSSASWPRRATTWGRCASPPGPRLHDVAYVQSVLITGGEQLPNDLTATVGAGFRAYLRNGPKAIWTAQVLPEYVWWLRQTERRQLNGRYSAGLQRLTSTTSPWRRRRGASSCSSWSPPRCRCR